MNKAIAVATAMLGLVIAMPAGATIMGFTDRFAPGLWTVAITGTPPSGSVTETPTTFTLVGGNGPFECIGATYGFLGPCEVDVIRTPIAPTTSFSFHWAYTTADSAGPEGDIFGMLVNGNRIQLSDPGGPIS